ncbi:MAG TPA: DoxX family protein [Puia sp.]|nr:DoxX family protein [Puia sp.]
MQEDTKCYLASGIMTDDTTANNSSRTAGLFFIRALLGLIFLMQGYGKVFIFGVGRVYQMFFAEFEKTFLPRWLITATAYYTSYIELIGGILLISGLFRSAVLYFLALDLLVVSFGHGLLEPIWDLSHVIPRALLLSALFFLPASWDKWRLDSLWRQNKN